MSLKDSMCRGWTPLHVPWWQSWKTERQQDLSEDSDTIGDEAVNSRDRYCFSAAVPQSSVLSIQGQNNVCLVTMGDCKMMMAQADRAYHLAVLGVVCETKS
jgi:hypothetical protein